MFRIISLVGLMVAGAAVQSGCVIVIGDEESGSAHWVAEYEDAHGRKYSAASADAMLDDVRERFDADDFLSEVPILISASDGVVTLRGEINDPDTLDRAVRIASEAPGVEAVVMKVVLLTDN